MIDTKAMRAAREAAGLTMMELAGKAGIHLRTLEELEWGRSTAPRVTTLALLADVLGIGIDEYIGRTIPPRRSSNDQGTAKTI